MCLLLFLYGMYEDIIVPITSGCMTIFPSNFREAMGDSVCVKRYNKMEEADIIKALH